MNYQPSMKREIFLSILVIALLFTIALMGWSKQPTPYDGAETIGKLSSKNAKRMHETVDISKYVKLLDREIMKAAKKGHKSIDGKLKNKESSLFSGSRGRRHPSEYAKKALSDHYRSLGFRFEDKNLTGYFVYINWD